MAHGREVTDIDAAGRAVEEDAAIWRRALARLRASSGASLTFGGSAEPAGLTLRSFDGAQTGSLRNLRLQPGKGLGGRVLAEQVPLAVDDYYGADQISHDYDRQVRGEGLVVVAAAPVQAGRSPRGVLYAGFRRGGPHGDRVLDTVVDAARSLAAELALQDEVRRRVRGATAEFRRRNEQLIEQLRAMQAGLVELQHATSDQGIRDGVDHLLTNLASQGRGERPRLSARERDVLALVATGLTYSTVAHRLGLAPDTVKSYMRDLLVRLGVNSRHAAVVEARRRGLIL